MRKVCKWGFALSFIMSLSISNIYSNTDLNTKSIINDLDWNEVGDLSQNHPGRIHSWPIADISVWVPTANDPTQAAKGRCTGFMVSDDIMMTNQHCVVSAGTASLGIEARFTYLKGTNRSSAEVFDCSEFIGNNKELDYALIRCEKSPGSRFGKVRLSSEQVHNGDSIYVVHQNCDYHRSPDCNYTKKYSEGLATDREGTGQNYASFSHTADTLGGSSGAPIFKKSTNAVIAIHNTGFNATRTLPGYGDFNGGVDMAYILSDMSSRFLSEYLEIINHNRESFIKTSFDGGDGDNFVSTARKISINEMLEGEIFSDQDIDYFRFRVEEKAKYKFYLRGFESSADIDIDLLDYKRSVIEKSHNENSLEEMDKKLEPGRDYYLKVFGHKGTKSSYEVYFQKD